MTDEANDRMRSPMSVQRAERELADLQKEISQLEAQIAAKRDRSVKLGNYVEMAREFAGQDESHTSTGPRASKTEGRRPPVIRGIWAKIVAEAVNILRDRSEPASARELVPLLANRGIRINTKTPDRALSQYLSREPGVVGDHARGNVGQGWFLIEWGDRFDITREAAAKASQADSREEPSWRNEAAE
jgi:hypothetical protein